MNNEFTKRNAKLNVVKCPNCGEEFAIDESAYSAIAIQVKDAEFEKSVAKRVKEEMQLKQREFETQFANVEKTTIAEKSGT